MLPRAFAVDGVGPRAEDRHDRALGEVRRDPLGVGAARPARLAGWRRRRRLPRPRSRGEVGEDVGERLDVAFPRGVAESLRLDVGERPERARQGLSGRHLGVVDEHRDHDRRRA